MNICNRLISQIHSIEADMLDIQMKFVQLQRPDQMKAQNEMLKERLSFYFNNNHSNSYVHQLYINNLQTRLFILR